MSARLLELLRRYGAEAVSFQALEPGLAYRDVGESCVAYCDTGGAWVAAGPPIGPPEERAQAMERFAEAARRAGKRPRFFAVEEPPPAETGLASLPIGEQPLWAPAAWPATLREVRSLREQLRRARAKGVSVRSASAAELAGPGPLRRRVEALAARWRESRSMPPMGFLVHLDLLRFADERRYLLAERDGRLVGLLVAVPVYATGGWLLEDVLRDPEAPNGTVELLIDGAMHLLAGEGARQVTFGLAPLAGVHSRALRWMRRQTRWLYDFEGLRAFKAKLRPASWQTVYLVHPAGERGARAILDSLAAFAGGSFLRFGLRTLVHRAPTVVWLLALMLLPWTAILAKAPAETWFPSPAVQAGWILYDGVLFAGLWSLARRWRHPLALALSAGAAADFALGLLQTFSFNAGRAAGSDWVFIGLALAAPLFAAIFLFSTRRRGETVA